MARRYVTLVLDLDEQGSPVEINRGWQEDEIASPTGGLGMTPRVNVDEATLAGILPDLATVTAQLVATQDARDVALADKAAAAALVAERDGTIAGLNAQVETLTSRIAELEAAPKPPSDRSIHKAWLRAALASIERLAEVDAAVQSAGPVHWELWANATTISRDDADVVAIAEALKIDLDAVFAAARAIQVARGGT